MEALTFDTSAMMALENRRRSLIKIVVGAARAGRPIVIPAGVVAEWWRGRTDRCDYVLKMGDVQPLTTAIAKLAGEALASLPRRGPRSDDRVTLDATVMATAALCGPTVYTGDYDDLARFQDYFPSVRILGLSDD